MKKIIKKISIFVLAASWLLTDWPGFWLVPNHRFPPKVTEVRAAVTQVYLTTADVSPWTVPNDWGGVISIEAVGGGKGGTTPALAATNGGVGGVGGGYSKITSFTTTGGSQITFQVGTGSVGATAPSAGGDTFFGAATCAGSSVCAIGGGSASSAVGTIVSAGGGAGTSSGKGGSGGGGAGGPQGAGKAGGNKTSTGGSGGGGSDGASATAGATSSTSSGSQGGAGYDGTAGGTGGAPGNTGSHGSGGGGGNGGTTGAAGGAGGTSVNFDASHGTGGGGAGGGGTSATSGNRTGGLGGDGGLYGGGGGGGGAGRGTGASGSGGNGGDGLIVITYTIDATAPTPNPMTFSSAPSNTSSSQIDMTASQASDNFVAQSAISYLFTNDNTNCGANAGNGGTTSTWQLNTLTYSDTGLDVNKCYGYYVQAKDTAGNTTAASTPTTVLYTSAAVPGTPILNTPTSTTLKLTNAENGNPATSPTTNFAVQVVTTTPTDTNWLNKWVDATGNSSATAVWMTDAQADAVVLQGLQNNTLYGVKIKAKNEDGDETALSAEGQGTTSGPVSTSFSQNKYLWYYDNDLINPTTAWGTPAIAENTAIAVTPAGKDPPSPDQEIRLRVNMVVNGAALSALSQYFKLEYKLGTDGSCTTGTWTDVGAGGWTYATSTVTDGSNITASLSDTTTGKGEQYAKSKPTALNNVGANVAEIIEYDFHLIGGSATPNATYSFRIVGTNSTATTETVLDAYTNCPTLTTEPGMADVLRHGNVFTNESEQGFFWVD